MSYKLLFLCTGNACRSQMAEGWTRYLHGDDIKLWSAGVAPAGVDSRAITVMAESGIDISDHTSKHVDSLLKVPFDYVITVCDSAAEACPVFPGNVSTLHRGFSDPPLLAAGAASDEEALAPYRRVRDDIRRFVLHLPDHLKTGKSS